VGKFAVQELVEQGAAGRQRQRKLTAQSRPARLLSAEGGMSGFSCGKPASRWHQRQSERTVLQNALVRSVAGARLIGGRASFSTRSMTRPRTVGDAADFRGRKPENERKSMSRIVLEAAGISKLCQKPDQQSAFDHRAPIADTAVFDHTRCAPGSKKQPIAGRV
jgi:hypothetical protein